MKAVLGGVADPPGCGNDDSSVDGSGDGVGDGTEGAESKPSMCAVITHLILGDRKERRGILIG
jgi:hypothetical protein